MDNLPLMLANRMWLRIQPPNLDNSASWTDDMPRPPSPAHLDHTFWRHSAYRGYVLLFQCASHLMYHPQPLDVGVRSWQMYTLFADRGDYRGLQVVIHKMGGMKAGI